MQSRTALLLVIALALPVMPHQRLMANPLADKDMKVEVADSIEKPQDAMPLEISAAKGREAIQEANVEALWADSDSYSIHSLIEAAAIRNEIPVWFLARLIRQESSFNPRALSPAGAMGIAQFMPATAAERGLADPFDPVQAISKSAELLKELKGRFSNLGLAAAAYNAGPQRVQTWLAGRGGLPLETRSYVLAITGRPVQDWAPQGISLASLSASTSTKAGTTLLTSPTQSLIREGSSAVSLLDAVALIHAKASSGAAVAQDNKLKILLQAEAQQFQPDKRKQKGRASSEQSLCSLMNSTGSACIVQKTY
jgi:hypothetical protein